MTIFLKKLNRTPKKILISRTDRIGDFMLTLPVFECLKSYFDLEITVLCNELVLPLIDNNPYVNRRISISKQDGDAEIIEKIRSYQFDTLLVMVNDPIICRLIPKLHFIPTRIGPLSKIRMYFHYTHPIIQKRSRSVKNEAEYNLELLEIFNLRKIQSPSPKLYFIKNTIKPLKERFNQQIPFDQNKQQKIIFHSGMSGSALNWPFEFYQELLEKLLEEKYFVILTGTGESEIDRNQLLIQQFQKKYKKNLIDLTNQLNLKELATLISACNLYIGPSTGPTHIAAATGTKVITFYPPIQVQSAERWGPFKANATVFSPQVTCGRKYKCKGKSCELYDCFTSITPANVMAQVHQYLPESL